MIKVGIIGSTGYATKITGVKTTFRKCLLKYTAGKYSKTQKKADFSQHFRGSRKVQTFRVKNAVSGCRFTPGKAPRRVAQQGQEAPRPSPRQG